MAQFLVRLVSVFLLLTASAKGQDAPRDPIVSQCLGPDSSGTWRDVARAWATDSGHPRRNDSLRSELLELRDADRKLRSTPAIGDSMTNMGFLHRMAADDSTRGARLKQLVERHGWPGKSIAGADGSSAAFLIVQHNGFLQRDMLALMKEQPAGEVNPADVAMLEDRLNVQEGRPQRFGSQLKPPGATTLEYYPIQDLSGVDARRATAGLVPLAVYSCIIGKRYNRTVVTPAA